jgi:hypothetical protein
MLASYGFIDAALAPPYTETREKHR